MGLRYRRSIKICKGLKLNFGKTGASVTVGSGSMKKTFHTNGNVTTTVGLPGTGIYWTETERRGSQRNNQRSTSRANTSYISDSNRYSYEIPDSVDDYFEAARNPIEHPIEQPIPSDLPKATPVSNTNYNQVDCKQTSHFLNKADIRSMYMFGDAPVEWTEIVSGSSADDLLMDNSKYEFCRTVANKILSGDINSYLETIEACQPVADLLLYCGDFEFGTDSPSCIEVEFSAKPENVLQNGINDNLLDEFISAVSIRVARDIFALLPVSSVIIHATIADQTILSVRFIRNGINRINFKSETAKEIIMQFEHHCVDCANNLHDVPRIE